MIHHYLALSVVAPKMTAVCDIKCGKIELALTVRFIHLWSVPAEEGSLHILLLDEKVYMAHI